MPLRIFNNLSSVIAQNRLDVNNRNLGEVISRIASGDRLFGEPRPMQRKKLHQNYLILIRGLLDKHQKTLMMESVSSMSRKAG